MYPRVKVVLAALAAQAPTLLILAALAGLACWGYANDWKAPSFSALFSKKAEAEKRAADEEKGQRPGEGLADPLPVVKFDSADAAREAGVDVATVGERPMDDFVTAQGEVDFNQNYLAHLSSRAPGTVFRVFKQDGDPVKKGEVLALVESPQLSQIKFDFQQTRVRVETNNILYERMQGTAVAESRVREFEASLRELRIRLFNDQQSLTNLGLPVRTEDLDGLSDEEVGRRLRLLGLPEEVVRQLDPATLSASLLPLNSPFDGQVMHRDMVVGEVLTSSSPTQFTVADVSRLWIILHVRLEDVGRLAVGQEVFFRPDSVNEEVPPGKVAWISAEVEEKTRTVRVRVEAPNPTGRLKPRMFGTGRIRVRSNPRAVVVPETALQWDGRSHLVFVRQSNTLYQPRQVLVGARADGYAEVLPLRPVADAGAVAATGPYPTLAALLAGQKLVTSVRPGEEVVTAGSHVLKSEMLKDRIGGEDD